MQEIKTYQSETDLSFLFADGGNRFIACVQWMDGKLIRLGSLWVGPGWHAVIHRTDTCDVAPSPDVFELEARDLAHVIVQIVNGPVPEKVPADA